MAIRNIVEKGDTVLDKVCRPVTAFNERLWELLDDMHDTLRAADGAGLAAPQVGVLRSCALVMMDDGSYLEIINPKIVSKEGFQSGTEGCLSVPGVFGIVERPMNVTVTAQDRYGKEFTVDAEGFTARAFCHEIDHLSGHLFTELVKKYVDLDNDEE
ncbi:MAG: peptide deformylase [Clostridia bacterium]|nr:peptide deformylase [Clostridia bacterium]MBR4955792.1 peptide deformylase [Clostridia bacterium]